MTDVIDLSSATSPAQRLAILFEALAVELRNSAASSENRLQLLAPASKGRVDEPETPVTTPIEPKPKKALPQLLDADDMAALLGCHPRTLRRWELDGRIPKSVRIGGSKRWRRSTVEQWLEGKR